MRLFKLILFALAFSAAGCGSSLRIAGNLRSEPRDPRFVFQLSFQPRAFLKPDTNTILIVNRVDISKRHLQRFDMETAKAGIYTALKFAGDQLAQVQHVRVISLADSLNLAVNTDSIATLARKYHADYTLALEKYEDTVVFDNAYRNRQYYDNKVDLLFTMYLGKGNLYKDLRGADTLRSVQRERDFVATELSHVYGDANMDFIVNATQNAVFLALTEYLPYTETESRPLYAEARFSPLANAIIAGRYNRAYQLAQPLLSDSDPIAAGQAAYNMAVAYEAQGNLDKATEMARLALAKSKSLYASALLNYLNSK